MVRAIITNLQNKGGDGKTALTRLQAEYLSKQGYSVLLLDLDPQCNLSQVMIQMDFDEADTDGRLPPVHQDYPDDDEPEWDGRFSSADILYGRPLGTYDTRLRGVEIIPGRGKYLAAAERAELETSVTTIHNAYREILSEDAIQEKYDFILIDTPPAKGHLTQAAVRAATHLVIPMQSEPLSMDGMRGMMQLWRREQVGRQGRPLRLLGIVVNKFKRNTALHEGIFQSLRDDEHFKPWLVPHVLGNRVAFAEADHPNADPRSVFDLPKSNTARREAEAVMDHLFAVLANEGRKEAAAS